nr:lysine-specific demethylase 6B-like [Equus asinus]
MLRTKFWAYACQNTSMLPQRSGTPPHPAAPPCWSPLHNAFLEAGRECLERSSKQVQTTGECKRAHGCARPGYTQLKKKSALFLPPARQGRTQRLGSGRHRRRAERAESSPARPAPRAGSSAGRSAPRGPAGSGAGRRRGRRPRAPPRPADISRAPPLASQHPQLRPDPPSSHHVSSPLPPEGPRARVAGEAAGMAL